MRGPASQHHRRRDSTPVAFGDLSLVHPGGERLTSPPQPMHARRHSAAGALTGLLNESPATEQRLRRRRIQEDMDAVRSARNQVRTVNESSDSTTPTEINRTTAWEATPFAIHNHFPQPRC